VSTHQNLKQSGQFDYLHFVIYTNSKIIFNFSVQSEDSDLLSMLSSGTNCGNYVTFDEDINTEVSKFLRFLNIATSSRTGQIVCKGNICEYRNCEK
jgi:hypothetical protein